MSSARESFVTLAASIDQAMDDRRFEKPRADALKLGFSSDSVRHGPDGKMWGYGMTDERGDHLLLEYGWKDSSLSASQRGERHQFKLSLRCANGDQAEHSRELAESRLR